MSAGRRGLVLSVAFLGLALWLSPAKRAHAQFPQPVQNGPGKHAIWQQNLSPDQVRELLAKFGQTDGKEDPFEELVRRLVQDKNRGADPKQVDDAVKRFMNNKEFRDRVMDLAQKQKNQMGNNGQPPKLSPQDQAKLEDLVKQLKIAPDNGNGGNADNPFKLPEEFPPFDPRNPQFDPKRFPKIDPDNPPEFDPKTKFPLDPDTGRPFDPRNGRPIDPKNPPKIDPPPPPKVDPTKPVMQPKFDAKGNPVPPPAIDPKTGRPVEQPNPQGDNRKFDPDNPLGEPKDSPEKIAKTKAVEAANALWEKNVGPIDESPAVKRAILDLVSDTDAMEALTDGKGNNFFESLQKGDNDEKFGNLFGDGGDSGWEWPKLDLNWSRGRDMDVDVGPDRSSRDRSSWSRDSSSSRSRSGPSSLDGMGGFDLGGMKVPWLVVLILLALIIGAVMWWKWGAILMAAKGAKAAEAGVAAWPIDPREIKTREDVVKAFEFLSVLLCGPGAKTWTHSTIAEELSMLAETHGETAIKLARLYELARYAPLDEPLTRAELLEARRLACDLAGIDEA